MDKLFGNLSPFNYTSLLKSQQSRALRMGQRKEKKRARVHFIFSVNPLTLAVIKSVVVHMHI